VILLTNQYARIIAIVRSKAMKTLPLVDFDICTVCWQASFGVCPEIEKAI
jgi:hypothetical protein